MSKTEEIHLTGEEKLRTDVIAIVQNEITVVDAET